MGLGYVEAINYMLVTKWASIARTLIKRVATYNWCKKGKKKKKYDEQVFRSWLGVEVKSFDPLIKKKK